MKRLRALDRLSALAATASDETVADDKAEETEATTETVVEEAELALETARRDTDRSEFLRALMPMVSGERGKRMIKCFLDHDVDGFSQVWGEVTGEMMAKCSPSTSEEE